jgi:hypothetical protein
LGQPMVLEWAGVQGGDQSGPSRERIGRRLPRRISGSKRPRSAHATMRKEGARRPKARMNRAIAQTSSPTVERSERPRSSTSAKGSEPRGRRRTRPRTPPTRQRRPRLAAASAAVVPRLSAPWR